ncbi:MAG: NAD-dependent epimerase/dehydratase family protein, partial [Anaerolineae bacterium]
ELFCEHADVSAIIHTATLYGRRGEPFSSLLQANVLFPLKLLEGAQRQQATLFINTDTFSPAYTSDYAFTKKFFLQRAHALCFKEEVSVLNMRLEHLYGPGDSSHKFIPWLISNLLCHTPHIPLTLGEQRRDFIYVTDVANAYLCALQNRDRLKNGFSELSVGSGEARTVRSVAEELHRYTQSSSRLLFGAQPYPQGEVMHSQADPLALHEMGWSCQISLDVGLQKTIAEARYRSHHYDSIGS